MVHRRLLDAVDETVVQLPSDVVCVPLRGEGEAVLAQSRGQRLLVGDKKRYASTAARTVATAVGCPHGCSHPDGRPVSFTSTHATFFCQHPALVAKRIGLLHAGQEAAPAFRSGSAKKGGGEHTQLQQFVSELRAGVGAVSSTGACRPMELRGMEFTVRDQRRAMGGYFDGVKGSARRGAAAVHRVAAASAALLATAKVLGRDLEASVSQLTRENWLLRKYGGLWLAAVRRTGPGRREALATAHWVRARAHIFMIGLRRGGTVTAGQLRQATAIIGAKTRVAVMRARLLHPIEEAGVTAVRWQLAALVRRWRLAVWTRRGLLAASHTRVCEDGRFLAAACLSAVGTAGAPLTWVSAWSVTARLGSVTAPGVDTHRLLPRGGGTATAHQGDGAMPPAGAAGAVPARGGCS